MKLLRQQSGCQLRDDLANYWPAEQAFERAAHQDGEIFRAREGRRTLRFGANGKSYFLKYHAGIGWKEVVKNLTQGKLPVLSAMNEVRAIRAISLAGVDTMTIAGFGERGSNPAHIESFIVTDDLTATLSLEDAAIHWAGKVPASIRRRLVSRLGEIVGRMHTAGVNHRDLYLCHFLMKQSEFAVGNMEAPLYLIDLHRSQCRQQVPRRWLTKDLGGLYFSAAPLALSRTDIFRFIRAYSGQQPATELRQNIKLWKAVQAQAYRLYRRAYGNQPSFPLAYQPPLVETAQSPDANRL